VVARVAGQQAKRSRMVRAATSAFTTTARAFGRVLHQLWLEVTGFIFLAMAGIGAIEAVREYSKYQAGRASVTGTVVAICFTVTFAWFGISSFVRVKPKGKGGVR